MTETDGGNERTQVHGSWTEDGPVIAVTEAVATVTGRDVAELPPLHGYVEMEALERMLNGQRDRAISVSFSYESTTVSLESNGDLFVTRNEHLDG